GRISSAARHEPACLAGSGGTRHGSRRAAGLSLVDEKRPARRPRRRGGTGAAARDRRHAAAGRELPPSGRQDQPTEPMMGEISDRKFDWVAALAFASGAAVIVPSLIAMAVALIAAAIAA